MKEITEDTPIWEIIQHEFINLGKESVVKKEFSEMILSKYPHIKKGTLSAQISIQVINKRSRTNYNQCGKERVCGDNKFDFLFEQEDKTLCKYDKSKHGTWEIYKRDDGKLDVRIILTTSIDHTKVEVEKIVEKIVEVEKEDPIHEGKPYYTDVPSEKVLFDQIIAEENNDEVILNLVRYFENNKMTDKEVFLLTAQILEINKDAQVAAEIARLLINAGQNKSFAFSLLLDKKDYTGDDWSFNAFDEIKAELIAENNMLAVGDDIVDNLDSDVVDDVSKEITQKMRDEMSYTGKGTYTYGEGARKGATYVGEFRDGLFYGQGTLTYADGAIYVGKFKGDVKYGQGKMTYPSGDKYVGEWNGEFHGKGTYTYVNGEKYVGELKNGNSHGQGTYVWPDGGSYVGEYKDGNYHGKGKMTYPDGGSYVGEYKDGHKHGQGKMTYDDGSTNEGLFENGNYIGENSGEPKADQKDIVEKKELKDKMIKELAELEIATQRRKHEQNKTDEEDNEENLSKEITQKMLDDGYTGQGTATWPDGDKYVGEWKGGKQDGQGTFTSGGKTWTGSFKNGKLLPIEMIVEKEGDDQNLKALEPTGNLLTDLFGTEELVSKSSQFKELLKQKNQIPFVHFDGENDFENKLFVIKSNGEKATFKQIYDELGYKLNRGPFFYFSECVVNYTFKTFIIFVQDGWILEDPNNKGAIVLYPWDKWGEVLFTKHKDMDSSVILMAFPTQENASELSISPKLDLKTNVVMSSSEGGGLITKYTDDLHATMTFAYLIIKRYWQVVEDNRDKSTNTIPMETFYILNEQTINSLDHELQSEVNL